MSARVVHFEVPFDDADRARGFYRDVFDWQIQPMPEMDYNMVSTGPASDEGMPSEPGYIGGGMMQRQAPVHHRRSSRWQVDDIDATLIAVEKHGGRPSARRWRSATWASPRTSTTARATSWDCGKTPDSD